jgi:seryl-tRNA synthetase
LEYKISILDKTAFACEQDCRRKEQQVQELIDKKNRIEKLIEKILNNDNEGYSMLKQLVKENVKAALSENKKVISVALTALVQTLTSDPQTINIIYKIQAANEDGQHKDDNNDNVTKYFESNKDKILDLAKKHYENIVEALTNKFIGTTATASPSSSPTLSLPQSSSTFPNLSDQSKTYSIEEPEIYYDNSKGDIAD